MIAKILVDDVAMWTTRPALPDLPGCLTGDLSEVNLANLRTGSSFGIDGIEIQTGPSSWQSAAIRQIAQGVSKVIAVDGTTLATMFDNALIPGRSGFSSTGRFLLAPEPALTASGDSDLTNPGFQGTFRLAVSIDGRPLQTTMRVSAGYSLTGSPAVTSGTDILAVLRRQQRLANLGFVRPVATGDGSTSWAPLATSGVLDADTRLATSLFNGIALSTATVSKYGEDLVPAAIQVINTQAAPRWAKLGSGGSGWTNANSSLNQDWGSSLAFSSISSAGLSNSSGAQIRVDRLSLPTGGDSPADTGHETGLDIAVQLVSTSAGALSTGPWYSLATAQGALGGTGSFWAAVSSLSAGTMSVAQAREFALGAAGITSTNTSWEVDQLISWVDSQRIASSLPGKAFADAVLSRATTGANQFDRGLDAIVGKRTDYDRGRTVQQMTAFGSAPLVGRIVFNDPVARRLAATVVPASVSLAQSEGCNGQLRIEVRRAETPISQSGLQSISEALSALADRLSEVQKTGELATALPLVGRLEQPPGASSDAVSRVTLGQSADGSASVRARLREIVATYAASTATPTFEGLASALRSAGSTVGINVQDASVGLSILLADSKSVARPLGLGQVAAAQGITLNGGLQAPFSSTFELKLGLTISRDPSVSADASVTLGVEQARYSGSISASNLSFGLNFGVLACQSSGASIQFNPSVGVPFKPGSLSIAQWRSSQLPDLLSTGTDGMASFLRSGSLAATIPVQASLGGVSIAGSSTIALSLADPFSGSDPGVNLANAAAL
ncbi:MAG: hypothetical protein ACKO26_21690, partial [Planctomycetota bacterium]